MLLDRPNAVGQQHENTDSMMMPSGAWYLLKYYHGTRRAIIIHQSSVDRWTQDCGRRAKRAGGASRCDRTSVSARLPFGCPSSDAPLRCALLLLCFGSGGSGVGSRREGGGDDERQQELHIRWLVVFTEGEAIQLTYSTAVQVTGVSEILQYP